MVVVATLDDGELELAEKPDRRDVAQQREVFAVSTARNPSVVRRAPSTSTLTLTYVPVDEVAQAGQRGAFVAQQSIPAQSPNALK